MLDLNRPDESLLEIAQKLAVNHQASPWSGEYDSWSVHFCKGTQQIRLEVAKGW